MTTQSKQHEATPQELPIWRPGALEALADLCQKEGLNPVRLRRLLDDHLTTKRKPSRQQLIDALKHRPRIQKRAEILGSVTKKLNIFIETYIQY